VFVVVVVTDGLYRNRGILSHAVDSEFCGRRCSLQGNACTTRAYCSVGGLNVEGSLMLGGIVGDNSCLCAFFFATAAAAVSSNDGRHRRGGY